MVVKMCEIINTSGKTPKQGFTIRPTMTYEAEAKSETDNKTTDSSVRNGRYKQSCRENKVEQITHETIRMICGITEWIMERRCVCSEYITNISTETD